MEWISVKDGLPEIPEGKYGIRVLVVEFDPIYEELHPGRGSSVNSVMYAFTKDASGKSYPMYEGSNLNADFMTIYFGEGHEWGPTGDVITHWMYLPNPPK